MWWRNAQKFFRPATWNISTETWPAFVFRSKFPVKNWTESLFCVLFFFVLEIINEPNDQQCGPLFQHFELWDWWKELWVYLETDSIFRIYFSVNILSHMLNNCAKKSCKLRLLLWPPFFVKVWRTILFKGPRNIFSWTIQWSDCSSVGKKSRNFGQRGWPFLVLEVWRFTKSVDISWTNRIAQCDDCAKWFISKPHWNT